MNPLKELESCGQSPWLDDLRKTLMSSGELKRLIEQDGLKGLTSNPAIFEKSIGSTNDYDDVLSEMLKTGSMDDMTVYETIAIADIQAAADAFRPVYDAAHHNDGFVSLEVAPTIANDTEATKKDAKRLWHAVDRPNLMIKIPGTDAGTPAIEATIAEGINVNVTLLFSVKAYEDVAHAYIAGLKKFADKGGDVSRVASVASFFLSRIDSAADAKIDALKDADPRLVEAAKHKIAIANAKRAYQRSKTIFSGPLWEELAAKGAHKQRLLWASTGTKDKALPDTYYVDNIIGPETVNTMPPATLAAFRDHGKALKNSIESDVAGAETTLAALQKLGISLDEITHDLVVDGVQKFEEAFDKLLGGVAKRRKGIRKGSVEAKASRGAALLDA